jgi:hypothetical protein
MTLFNFNLPLDLPLELAIDAVSDYSPTPAPFARKQPVVDPGRAALDVLLAKLSKTDLPGVEQHVKNIFLVEKGPRKGSPISVRGIQKRMEC